MGFLGSVGSGFKHITVEPLILLFFWSIPYIDHGNGVLLFNKFCMEDFNDTSFCEEISLHKELHEVENVRIQSQTSRWIMFTKVTMVVPMLYSTTILGAISDRFQRKLPMVIPAVGVCVGCLWLMTMSLVAEIRVEFILISSFIFGITGYFGSALMATSAYLGVLTTAQSRTWRISVYEAALSLGIVAGSTTSGLIIDHLGLPTIYGITAGINLIAVLYTVIRIVELHEVKSQRPLWYELCEFSHVKEYLYTLYKPRAQSRRLYIHLIFAAFMVGTCSSQGLYDVLFLYLTKTRGFTNSLFSAFTGTQAVIQCAGNLIAMYVLKKWLNFTEPAITIVSAMGSAIGYSLISADDLTAIWISVIFIFVAGLNGGACRGFLSKLVPPVEQGQVFAFVAMGQCLTALLASVIFNNIYPETLKIWEGLCILLAGLMNIIAVMFALVVFFHRRVKGHTDEELDLSPDEPSVTLSQLSNGTSGSKDLSDEEDQIYSAPEIKKEMDEDSPAIQEKNLFNKADELKYGATS